MPWQDWIRTVEIEPSLRGTTVANRPRQVEALLRSGCRLFHLDVGEGPLDEPPERAPEMLRELGPLVDRYEGAIDVHLRGYDPVAQFATLADAGCKTVTVTAAAATAGAVAMARTHGLQVGVALEADADTSVAAGADVILYIGVRKNDDSTQQVRRLAEAFPGVPVQVEGAVSLENIRPLRSAGATVFIVGTAIFEREDLPRAYRRLVQELA
jgi:ribulose-phosphate 3-epimerase